MFARALEAWTFRGVIAKLAAAVQSPAAPASFENRLELQGVRNGGQGRNRTADTGIFNPQLYQLSYLARGNAY